MYLTYSSPSGRYKSIRCSVRRQQY